MTYDLVVIDEMSQILDHRGCEGKSDQLLCGGGDRGQKWGKRQDVREQKNISLVLNKLNRFPISEDGNKIIFLRIRGTLDDRVA